MNFEITDDCINCSACRVECPNDAISEPGKDWNWNNEKRAPISIAHYFIQPYKCDGCVSFESPKCISICPMNAIVSIVS